MRYERFKPLGSHHRQFHFKVDRFRNIDDNFVLRQIGRHLERAVDHDVQRELFRARGVDPAMVADQKARGTIAVPVDGETIEIPEQAAEIVVESLSAGEAVDVLRLDAATVLVRR